MTIAKRAVIMAAGKGTRLRPVTLEIPKPLVRVNGVRLIDTAIQALHAHNIREIYVVVGYLKEKFRILEEEYPGLTLIENPWYDTCNNISSLYCAREHLEEAIIMDGDQLIRTPDILHPVFELSGYNCIWKDHGVDEWLYYEKDGLYAGCDREGGPRGWQSYSISRWTAADGARLRRHVEIEFEQKRHRQFYWDEIVLFQYPQEYKMAIYPMTLEDMVEIDTLAELAALDGSYRPLLEGDKT